ncbi:putative tail protein [Achromobacter phage AXY1]|nr:putative tail protein [Achromobacter phage AXY1]
MSGGSSGGSAKMTVADYYMSIHYGVCMGPIDEINDIRINDKPLGLGGYSSNTTVGVRQFGMFGGSRKNGGVAGKIDFMFGGIDQMASPSLAQRLGRVPENCPGFRGITSLFFYDGESSRATGVGFPGFYWGSNFPTIPPVDVTVTRYPVGPNGDKMPGPNGLCNPAHIIYECLTNRSWAMGCPVGLIDIPSFQAAANTLAAEGFWMGLGWYRSDTIENFIGEVLDHIQAALGPDPATGKWRIKLLRDDYDMNNLFIVHPGNASITKMQRKLWGETANEVSVTWTNPANEEEESITVHDDANIAAQGQVVTTTRNYYGVRDPNLASRLALRDLRQSASPLLSVDVEIDRRGWNMKPGDVVELRWPEYGIGSCFMRVGDINYGELGSSRIQTSLLEDIFGLGSAIFTAISKPQPGDPAPVYPPARPGTVTPPPVVTPIPPSPQPPEWVDTSEAPRPLDYEWVGTTPYFMLARLLGDTAMATYSYPMVAAMTLTSQNSKDTQTIGRWAKSLDVTGNAEYEQQGLLPNMLRGQLSAPLAPAAVSTIPALSGMTGLGQPLAGMYVLIHDAVTTGFHEICAIETVNSDGSLTIRRAAIDTVPINWPPASPAFVFDGNNGIIFDPVQYADGAEVGYRFTPVTSLGALAMEDAPEVNETVSGRPHYPYRPANVAINGDLWSVPAPVNNANLTITWSRRNRITETGQLLRWTDADVAPEAGQTTSIIILNSDGTQSARIDGLTGTSYTLTAAQIRAASGPTMQIKLVSMRDGLESFTGMYRTISRENIVGGYGLQYGFNYGG